MYTPLLNKIETLEPLIEATEKPELMDKERFLYERISNPESHVVLLGETSSGKSSIINGLIGMQLLPVKASPSTAAISEIVFNQDLQTSEYYSISKNAEMRKITEQEFCTQCETPADNLARLRAHVGTKNPKFYNLRVFDTPGYGAIIDEHEEILKDFIPNSDIVIYTVSYKVGIQDYDYSFLGFLRELLRDDVKIVLAINRCPVGIDIDTNLRIKEIKSYVSDLLAIEPQIFCIDNIVAIDNSGHAMPTCNNMWEYIEKQISSEQHKKLLYDAFDGYIHDLYSECDNIVQIKYKEALLNDEECRKIRMAQRKFAEQIRLATKTLVQPTFASIKSKSPRHIEDTANRVNDFIIQKISEADRLSKDEMVAYTNSHLIPFTIKKEMGEVIQFIDVELSDLNRKLEDYIQKEIVSFKDNVEIILDSNFDSTVKSIAQEYIKKIMGNALSEYFLKYAGAAGIRGGAANAASHTLKFVGNWFNKTFSKQTHELVQRWAASAAKMTGVAIAVVTEILFDAYDVATWKRKLTQKVKEGVGKWEEDTTPMVIKDMDELMETNISTLYAIAKQMEDSIEETSSTDIDMCKKNVLLSESIKKQLKY
jgi:GTPase SAR1 family protein